MYCSVCGAELLTGDSDGMCSYCRAMHTVKIGESQNIFGNYGWICPVCGRGNSPYTQTCPCMPINYVITS